MSRRVFRLPALLGPGAVFVAAALVSLTAADTAWRTYSNHWGPDQAHQALDSDNHAHLQVSVKTSSTEAVSAQSALERIFAKRHLTEAAQGMLDAYGPRRVYAIRKNYYAGCDGQGEKYQKCAAQNGIDLKPRWAGMEPAGVQVLFIGNSYMLQIKQALVLGIDDSTITNEFYILPSTSNRTSLCRGCPCILYPEGQGHMSGSCSPVDVRAMNIKPGLICDTRQPSDDESAGNVEVPFWCIDTISKVQLTDGSTLATVKNVAQMNFKEGIRDAASSLDVRMDEVDVIIANEGNSPTFNLNKCGNCHGEKAFDHFINLMKHAVKRYQPGERIMRPVELLTSLKRHRFNGTLLYIANESWEDIPEETHARWREAVQQVKPRFRVEPYEIMSPTFNQQVVACGNVACHGGHQVMPGVPTIRARVFRDKIASVMEGRQPIRITHAERHQTEL